MNKITKKRLATFISAIFLGLLLSACSGELTEQKALEQITAQEEFQKPYYAPLRIGELVLTGEHFADPEGYIRTHYGDLIDAGLLQVAQSDRNSWRVVIDVQLSEQGRALADTRRSTPKEVYVQVCRMVPTQINELRTITEGKVIECHYTFEEQDITPFGRYCKFQQGRTYKDQRVFVRARGSWHLQ